MKKNSCNHNIQCHDGCKRKESSKNPIIWANEMATFMYHEKKKKGLVIHINEDEITLVFLSEENKMTLVEIDREKILQSHCGEFIPQKLRNFNEAIDYKISVADSDEYTIEIVKTALKKQLKIVKAKESRNYQNNPFNGLSPLEALERIKEYFRNTLIDSYELLIRTIQLKVTNPRAYALAKEEGLIHE